MCTSFGEECTTHKQIFCHTRNKIIEERNVKEVNFDNDEGEMNESSNRITRRRIFRRNSEEIAQAENIVGLKVLCI